MGGVAEVVLGVAEVVLGVAGEAFTGGLSTALIIDGVYRIGMNSFRLGAYLSNNKHVGNALPGNLGGMAGKIIDGANGGKFLDTGPWQTGLGVTNDVGAFIFSGGNASSLYGVLLAPTNISRSAHAYTIFSNYYTVTSYGKK